PRQSRPFPRVPARESGLVSALVERIRSRRGDGSAGQRVATEWRRDSAAKTTRPLALRRASVHRQESSELKKAWTDYLLFAKASVWKS
ncbi:hypothetical protein EJB05_20665, partial [Eragrostis curvula]